MCQTDCRDDCNQYSVPLLHFRVYRFITCHKAAISSQRQIQNLEKEFVGGSDVARGGHRCTSPVRGGKISILLFVLYCKLFSVRFLTVISGFCGLRFQTLCPWTPLGDFRVCPFLNEILATPLVEGLWRGCLLEVSDFLQSVLQ